MIFEVNAPADAKLYAARSDGTSLHALPIPSLRAIYPAVSPDGKTLAYLATDASSKSRITLSRGIERRSPRSWIAVA